MVPAGFCMQELEDGTARLLSWLPPWLGCTQEHLDPHLCLELTTCSLCRATALETPKVSLAHGHLVPFRTGNLSLLAWLLGHLSSTSKPSTVSESHPFMSHLCEPFGCQSLMAPVAAAPSAALQMGLLVGVLGWCPHACRPLLQMAAVICRRVR